MSKSKLDPLSVALHQLSTAPEHLNLDSGIHEALKYSAHATTDHFITLAEKMEALENEAC